jgi:hypothetical protein
MKPVDTAMMRHETVRLVRQSEALRAGLRELASHLRGQERTRLLGSSITLVEVCAGLFEVTKAEHRYTLLERGMLTAAKLSAILRGLDDPRALGRESLKMLRALASELRERRDRVCRELRGRIRDRAEASEPIEAATVKGPIPAPATRPAAVVTDEQPSGVAAGTLKSPAPSAATAPTTLSRAERRRALRALREPPPSGPAAVAVSEAEAVR